MTFRGFGSLCENGSHGRERRLAIGNFYPFVLIIVSLTVVNPYGVLCSGLLLLLTAANNEIARKSDIEKKLDYIARRLEQLKVITQLPETIVPTEDLVNRATDVRWATLKYIALKFDTSPSISD